MFSTKNLVNYEPTNEASKYLAGGIHENVIISGAKFDKTPNNNLFIELTFDKDGQVVKHTEWEPTKRPMDDEATFQKKVNNQILRLMQVLKCYLPEEQLIFNGANFQEFALWVTSILNNVARTEAMNKPVRLKIVYNDKGYTTLPNYTKFQFIEPMDVEKSKIFEIKNIDVFERPQLGDKEVVQDNPFEVIAAAADANQNQTMPFGQGGDDMPMPY